MVAETASIIRRAPILYKEVDYILIIKFVTRLYFISWSLANAMCKQRIDDYKKSKQINANFDGHAAGAIRCDAHRPMERIRGFM